MEWIYRFWNFLNKKNQTKYNFLLWQLIVLKRKSKFQVHNIHNLNFQSDILTNKLAKYLNLKIKERSCTQILIPSLANSNFFYTFFRKFLKLKFFSKLKFLVIFSILGWTVYQLTFTCLKSTIGTLEIVVKYVQS